MLGFLASLFAGPPQVDARQRHHAQAPAIARAAPPARRVAQPSYHVYGRRPPQPNPADVHHFGPYDPSHGARAPTYSTRFLTALYGPYTVPPPPPARLYLPHRSNYSAAYKPTPAPTDASDSDNDDDELDVPEIPPDIPDRPLYEPLPQWECAKEQPLCNAVTLSTIHSSTTTSLKVMRGKIGNTEVTYLCKSWSRHYRHKWEGLYPEVKMFSSPLYLRDLQGDVVPTLINIYDSASAVSLAMQLPHPSFWMEASSDMPKVLKKEVVRAYLLLHSKGVVHGEPELRNILIGGDGRVTLINFHAARSRWPDARIGLQPAERGACAMELRQVMYKLNYEGARSRENAKMHRFRALVKRNEKHRNHGEPLDSPSMDDRMEPPPPLTDWKEKWTNNLDCAPRRHIVPGQSPAQIRQCIESFLATIQEMEEQDMKNRFAPVCLPIFGRRSPEASSTPSGSNPLKRKTGPAAEDPGPSPKRARDDSVLAGPMLPPASYEKSTKSYDSCGPSTTLLRATPKANPKLKPDSVRDFAYEPYDGPRGYYVPDPEGEIKRSAELVAHLRNSNAARCARQGLPYYRLDAQSLIRPPYHRHLPKGMHISLGALKRQREYFTSREEEREAKRRRVEADRAAALAENRAVRFNDDVAFLEPPREEDYAETLEREAPTASFAQTVASRAAAAAAAAADRGRGHRRARPTRSILKRTPPVKTFFYPFPARPSRFPEDDVDDQPGPADNSGPPPPRLGDAAPASEASGPYGPSSSLPNAPAEPGQALSSPGMVQARAGSSTERYDTSIGSDGEGATLSGALVSAQAPARTPTDEDLAGPTTSSSAPGGTPLASSVPATSRGGADAPALAHDPRIQPQSGDGEGSRSGHAPSNRGRDWEDEMEVEAILSP
ncbi:hypothetical protein C8Q77DRAFT_1152321 [Trametes polyzona]|nr:hypothetical protein C8Q77DRAFT_1152321 [Trametes polyzona]